MRRFDKFNAGTATSVRNVAKIYERRANENALADTVRGVYPIRTTVRNPRAAVATHPGNFEPWHNPPSKRPSSIA